MNLALLGTLAVITALVAMEWQRVLDREIRWDLYRLRDDLRMRAIEDRSLVGSELFWRLDRSLTGYCASLEELSLWVLLPIAVIKRREISADARTLQEELDAHATKDLANLYAESSRLLVRHLVVRHWPLVLLTLITVVGIVPLVVAYKRSARIMTAALLRPRLGEALMRESGLRAAA